MSFLQCLLEARIWLKNSPISIRIFRTKNRSKARNFLRNLREENAAWRSRRENDSHAEVEDRKSHDHQMCRICHRRHPLPCWYYRNQRGELVVRPDFECKVLVRMRLVNPERTRQRPGKNASISRSTDLHSRCSKSFLQLEKINLNLCLQGREREEGPAVILKLQLSPQVSIMTEAVRSFT